MARERYKFLYRAGDKYYWEGPYIDSRRIEISCSVTWFWSKTKK